MKGGQVTYTEAAEAAHRDQKADKKADALYLEYLRREGMTSSVEQAYLADSLCGLQGLLSCLKGFKGNIKAAS